jgi:AraC-like DNA-binding protein
LPKLVDDARFAAAKSLLANSATPVTQIANRLGYSYIATLALAFGRWAGVAPGRWRKQHLAR